MTGAPFAGAGACAALPSPPLRFADPLRVLLGWAALLYREGTLDARLLARAGVSAAELSAFADGNAEALGELRRLRLAGALFGRRELGALWRARVSEGLMGAARAGEVLALTRALAAAPDWAWEEEEEGSRAEGHGSRAEREALADKARAELARLAGELQPREGAERPDDAADPEEWARLERLGALLEKFDAAALTGEAPRRVRNASYACGKGRQPSATKAKRKPRR